MDLNTLLHTNRDGVRKSVLEKLEKTEDDVENDVLLLQIWFQSQKHLPETPSDYMLETFLIVNKFNVEKCKKKLENYYSVRQTIPDLYVDKNPKSEHMKDIAKTIYILPLPKITPSLSRVTIMKLNDTNPEKFHALNFFAHSYNLIEVRIREDVILTDTIVYDMEGFSLSHLFKLRFGPLRKASTVLEKVFSSRLEGIHYINLPKSLQILVNVVKSMLREKLRKRIHVHKDLESLQQHIPKELLPEDYGGLELSMDKLNDLWSKKLEEYQDIFDYLETLASANSDPTTETQDEEDDFRHLQVD